MAHAAGWATSLFELTNGAAVGDLGNGFTRQVIVAHDGWNVPLVDKCCAICASGEYGGVTYTFHSDQAGNNVATCAAFEFKFIDSSSFGYYCRFYATAQATTWGGSSDEWMATDSSVFYAKANEIHYLPSPPPSPPPPSPPPAAGRRLDDVDRDCERYEVFPSCRFAGHSEERDMTHIDEAEAFDTCCRACGDFDECNGFSFETTRTVLRATNTTARGSYSCVFLRKHEDLETTSHRRETYEALGRARVTRAASTCYVQTPESPPPPPPPPIPPTPSPTPPDPPPRSPPSPATSISDWWFQMLDLDDDHGAPWRNGTPVPKHRWYATDDAFERL